MRNFFHADTTRYRRRLKSMVIIVLVPLFAACVFCVVNIFLSLKGEVDTEFIALMLLICVGCVLTGMVFTFAAAYLTEKAVRRHSRFTYFDILPQGMVYSRYAGDCYYFGKREIYRRMYYIPFSGLEEISRDPKVNARAVTFKGEIRSFLLPSDHLGYHVDEVGATSFDNWELNTYGFDTLKTLEIRTDFGCTKHLAASAQHYLEQFRAIPEKKPFNIAEHIATKSKKRLRTSNPLLDAPSFSRKW